MDNPNIHTNIMLDLECTAGELPNPCIIEIGAIYFDFATGVEISHFQSPINLDSCLSVGLQKTSSSMSWLQDATPQTLETSRTSNITLHQALCKLTNFIQTNVLATRKRLRQEGYPESTCSRSGPRVWGNGAVADNVWISSAYRACGLKRPWDFMDDRCVRSLVGGLGELVGRDFAWEAKEGFQGAAHCALDDCRHQIRYLVAARNAVLAMGKRDGNLPPTPIHSQPSEETVEERTDVVETTPAATNRPQPSVGVTVDVWDLCSSELGDDDDEEDEFFSTMPLPAARKRSRSLSPEMTPRPNRTLNSHGSDEVVKETQFISSDATWSTNPSSDAPVDDDDDVPRTMPLESEQLQQQTGKKRTVNEAIEEDSLGKQVMDQEAQSPGGR